MYLGIDLGTSSVKVIVIDKDNTVVAQTSSSLDVSRPEPLWSEQDPASWWQATHDAISDINQNHSGLLSTVKSIGLSGQMHGATLLDANNNVIRPAILWNDGRSAQECAELEREVPNLRKITGNIAMPGFTAPKLVWLKKYEPDHFNQIAKVLLPKDYLRFLMTGDFASDMSDSAGTLWMDVKERRWSTTMLAATGLTESQMPTLYEGTQVTGVLSADIANQWQMQQVPLVAGGGDNAAGAVGIAVTKPNQAFISLGTSGVYFVANADYLPNPDQAVHTFCHCIPDTWHQMSVILSAASCLSWVTQLTGFKSEANLLAEVATLDFKQAGDVIFLPYLSGERTPHNNPHAKGTFFGLTHTTTAAELGRAVLEGVAFAFADGQQVLLQAGANIDHISVIGGGSRSPLWRQILASVLDQPLSFSPGNEVGPALGAAILAKAGVSEDHPVSEGNVTCKVDYTATDEVMQPDATMQRYYNTQYKKYRQLYQQLAPLF